MLKRILVTIAALFLLFQGYRPEKNLSNDNTYHVSTKYEVPADVNALLESACNDCHSNQTRYPWYAEIQPAASWLAGHVNDGKRHLNFSEFTKLPVAVQNHKFEEVIEMVKEGEMPLKSYTYLGLHADAKLTDAQRQLITGWAQAQMDVLKAQYPADSLVMKRRKG
jgi:hypothetical protein